MNINDKLFDWAMEQEDKGLENLGLFASGTLDWLMGTSEETTRHLNALEKKYATGPDVIDKPKSYALGYVGLCLGSIVGLAAGAIASPASFCSPLFNIEMLTRIARPAVVTFGIEKRHPEWTKTQYKQAACMTGPIGLMREGYAALKVRLTEKLSSSNDDGGAPTPV